MLRFLLLISFSTSLFASRILFYLPDPSISHVLLALPIAEELAQRGHQLTVVTNRKFLRDGNSTNYREVIVETRGFHGEILEMFSTGKIGKSPKFLFEAIQQFTDNNLDTLKSASFQKLMHEETFDLIFFQTVFFNNFQLGIADHFEAPWLTLSPMGNTFTTRDLLGTHSFASTVPTRFATYSPHMRFPQRVANFLGVVIENLLSSYMETYERKLYDELWSSSRYRSFEEMKQNASLVFLNGHWSESSKIRPTLPNEIEIGGIQIRNNPRPLEADVQEFLDNAHDGVILWTFGSTLPITSVDPDKLKLMFKVLGRLKEKVIIKWDSDDTNIQLPPNFMGRKWLLQDSILGHKNVKLFITHGGLGGIMEAAYHAVQIFGIPFFADQDANVAKAISEGWACGLKIFDITEESFSKSIDELLNNKQYRENVKNVSQRYRDREVTALKTAVFWVEYILKFHGAPHLNYSGKNLSFIQAYSLDVITFILFMLYVLFKVMKVLLKFTWRKLMALVNRTETIKIKKN